MPSFKCYNPNNMYKKIFFYFSITLSVLLLTVSKSEAQNKSYWEINYNLGTNIFFGDIKQNWLFPVSGEYGEWRIGTGFQVGKQISYVFGARAQFVYGQVAGTRIEFNRYFQSDYFETNLNFTLNFNNLFGNKRSNRFFNIYMIGGIGITQYNSIVYEMGTNNVLARVGKGGANGDGSGFGGRTLQGILTTGLGADFRINDKLHFNIESVHRGINSDAYDAWEKSYPYDIYNYTSIGITWRFAKKAKGTTNEKIFQHQQKQQQPSKIIEQKVVNEEPEPVPDTIKQVVIRYVQYVEPEETEKSVVQSPVQDVKTLVNSRRELEYRVQILAKREKPVSISFLKNKYHIVNETINEEHFSDYYKYLVGNYSTYEQARKKRDMLRLENGIQDAFVVAYYKGVRLAGIPAQ